MSVMRFTGDTSRDVMRRVRGALGDDALILANRRTAEGVEILAMADAAVDGMASRAAEPPQPSPPETPAAATAPQEAAFQAMSERLLGEMQDMRALLARERNRRHPAVDCAGRLHRLLREAGFGAELAEELLAGLPAELADAGADDERPLAWLQRHLAAQLGVLEDQEAFFAPAGVLALVGPTGVGKTTTTAKLAARFVERHGADRVALVTTDGFRIGAHEQLRIYAELLGIPMLVLNPDQPVDSLATRMLGRRWVIIDTVGMSQRDRRVVEQIARLQAGHVRVRMLLLLNAASQPETLDEVVTRYRQAALAAGSRLDDCLLTKQDEACRLAPALEAMVRHELRLTFVSHGQRVPEDLTPADAGALSARALATRSPLALDAAVASPSAMRRPPPGGGLPGHGRQLAGALRGLRRRLDGFTVLEAAWDLADLPDAEQRAGLERLLAEAEPRLERVATLWAPRRTSGGRPWRMPDLDLDARGHWAVLPGLQHHRAVGEGERLAAAVDAGVGAHLLPGLPEAATRRRLAEADALWAARVSPAQRCEHRGERAPLSRLVPLASPAGEIACRLRGKAVRASLTRLAVDLGDEAPQLAWFGELQETESGRTLGRRCWLTPEAAIEDTLPLLVGHLRGEGLARQTREAHARLAEGLAPGARPELRLLLAAGLAAAASHLDQAEDTAAMDLRADLLALLGGRRRRRDTALLQALLQLFATRDAIRRLRALDGEVP